MKNSNTSRIKKPQLKSMSQEYTITVSWKTDRLNLTKIKRKNDSKEFTLYVIINDFVHVFKISIINESHRFHVKKYQLN